MILPVVDLGLKCILCVFVFGLDTCVPELDKNMHEHFPIYELPIVFLSFFVDVFYPGTIIKVFLISGSHTFFQCFI